MERKSFGLYCRVKNKINRADDEILDGPLFCPFSVLHK